MNTLEKLNYLTNQLNCTKSRKRKNDLQKGIYKLNKKIKEDKTGMKKIGDNIYFGI